MIAILSICLHLVPIEGNAFFDRRVVAFACYDVRAPE